MDIMEKAEKMIMRYPLCDHCLGRQFALLGYGLNNEERGSALKTLLTMKAHDLVNIKREDGIALLEALYLKGECHMAGEILKKLGKRLGQTEECYLCEGRFKSSDDLIHRVLEMLEGYEFETFLVGVTLTRDVEEREDEFRAHFEVGYGENLRNEFSREVGKGITKHLKKKVDYKSPEMVILIDPFERKIILSSNPLFIAGHYRKLKRGLPQTKWLCPQCRGEGCEKCGWSGKLYPESIEEIISKPILDLTKGEAAILHGAGREDIDVLMLGEGRPFVMEIKKPKRRFVDLEKLMEDINKFGKGKIEVRNLRFADRGDVRKIKKTEMAEKVYRAVITLNREVNDGEIERLKNALNGARVNQMTPRRVLHRRADLLREKYIYEAKIMRLKPNMIEIIIRSEGGLYIKELINGDGGRTEPSVASILGEAVEVEKLDVLRVVERVEE